jgi:two-component system sensor kinase
MDHSDFKSRFFGNRFQPTQLLKEAQGIKTLLGTDFAKRCEVVIKIIPASRVSATAHQRLEYEMHMLRKIQSPHLVAPLAVGVEEDLFYIVRLFVQGASLAERLGRSPLPIGCAVPVTLGILRSLCEAHKHGLVHRNLKPANVILTGDASPEEIRLIDSGYSLTGGIDHSGHHIPLDTLWYTSPEAAGLLNRTLDGRSDLYAVGVLLFQLLTGHLPFEGKTIGELLQQHLSAPPPSLLTLSVSVPRILDELLQRLLRKDPRDRYQSAEAVSADLAYIATALEEGIREPTFVLGSHDRYQQLTESSFVGRSRELKELQKVFDLAKGGKGGLAFVEAESGGGKSRLLYEFTQRALQQGARVLHGTGQSQVGAKAFQILDDVASELISIIRFDPLLGERIAQGLGDHREAAIITLPKLAKVLGEGNSALLGNEQHGEIRAIQALRVLLDLLGSQTKPAIVILDDAQWSDSLSVKLLREWQSQKEAEDRSGRFVMIILSFRTEEVPKYHPIRHLKPLTELSLDLLGQEDMKALLESMAGPLPQEATTAVARLAEGNPFLAGAVLQGLVETGAIAYNASGWRVEPSILVNLQASGKAKAFLVRRLEQLPQEVFSFLTVGAVLGRSFDLEFALTITGQTSQEGFAMVGEAQRRHIVWMDADSRRCTFLHDKLRESLLGRLSEENRKRWHREAAILLESRDRNLVFDLAYHFDASSDPARAFPYALAAAERARSQYALEVAEQQYRIAERGLPAEDEALRSRVIEGLGTTMMLLGDYDKAGAYFEQARLLAKDKFKRVEIDCLLGDLAFKGGDLPRADERLQSCLRSLGYKVPNPKSLVSLLMGLSREAVVQAFHTFLPGLFLHRRKLEGEEERLLAARLYIRMGYIWWFLHGPIACLWSNQRSMNIAECYPPSPELQLIYDTQAPVMSALPNFSRSLRYPQKALTFAKARGDVWGQGHSYAFIGMAYYNRSDFPAAVENCREGIRLLTRAGDLWEALIAGFTLSAALYRMGNFREAISEARHVFYSGRQIGDIHGSSWCLEIWSKASGGRVPANLVQEIMGLTKHDPQIFEAALQVEGTRLLGEGRFGEAASAFEKAQKVADTAMLRSDYVAGIQTWVATCLRKEAEARPFLDQVGRQALLRRARRAARRGLRMARWYQNGLPHALRETGLLAMLEGRIEQAEKCLKESLEVAEHQGAKYEAAQTRLAQAELHLIMARPGANLKVEAARREVISFGTGFEMGTETMASENNPQTKPVTHSLVDRFSTLQEVGRKIVAAHSKESIYSEICNGILSLLRSEECRIIDINDTYKEGTPPSPVSEVESSEFIIELIRQSLKAGGSVVFTADMANDIGDRLLNAKVASVLCAPIVVRGSVRAVVFTLHRQIRSLFGEDEKLLAEFIAALAGVALENAEGLAEIQELSKSLERKIEERTAQLKEKNRDLESFVYAVSHDLKAPVVSMDGFASRVLEDYGEKLDDNGKRYLNRIQANVNFMQKLIVDLLEFYKVGKRSEKPEVLQTDVVLREVLQLCIGPIQRRNTKLSIHSPLPTTFFDPTSLKQIFLNLITNGVKFMGNQSYPRIEIGGREIDGFVEFYVKDNGIGIDPQNHEQIFGVFQRLKEVEVEGSGVGLATVKKIIDSAGGKIWLQSQRGQGTTFFFRIPKNRKG